MDKSFNLNENITNNDWDKVYLPYNNNLDKYMIKYIMPEVLSFIIAQTYYRKCLGNDDFETHFKSMLDIIEINSSLEDIKDDTINLLQIKYNLKVINENPLIVGRWE